MLDLLRNIRYPLVHTAIRGGTVLVVLVVGGALALRRLAICAVPGWVQRRTLRRIVTSNANSEFGRTHGFEYIDDYEAYTRLVPAGDYECFRPWINRSLAEQCNLLACVDIYRVSATSGTTGRPKQILQSKKLFRTEYLEYTAAILLRILLSNPLVLMRPLGIVASASEARRLNGFEGGNAANTLYRTSPFRRLAALSPALFDVPRGRARYYYFALFIMAARCRCIITPNPTTVLEIIDVGREHEQRVRADLDGELTNWFDLPEEVWTSLVEAWEDMSHDRADQSSGYILFADVRLVVTWTSGSCGYFARHLREQLDNVRVAELGYLATDSPICVPIGAGTNQVLAADSVFAEFLPVAGDDQQPRLYHELEEGQAYEIQLTNRYGLYRYAIRDIVQVTGRVLASPVFHFLRKSDGFSNITGEKLSEDQLCAAMERVESRIGSPINFFVSVPDLVSRRYEIFCDVECLEERLTSQAISELLDHELCELNVEYHSKRRDGRLNMLRVVRLEPGAATRYKHALLNRGARDIQFKVVHVQNNASNRSLLQSLALLER